MNRKKILKYSQKLEQNPPKIEEKGREGKYVWVEEWSEKRSTEENQTLIISILLILYYSIMVYMNLSQLFCTISKASFFFFFFLLAFLKEERIG